jgi:copper(I)-binding protein
LLPVIRNGVRAAIRADHHDPDGCPGVVVSAAFRYRTPYPNIGLNQPSARSARHLNSSLVVNRMAAGSQFVGPCAIPEEFQMSSKLFAYAAAGLLISAAAFAESGLIELKNAWARATPGGAENVAAYLTIESPVTDRLVGVSTPVAKKAELHTMSMDGGVMKMRPIDGIDVSPAHAVTLKPGGTHIMLLGLTHPLQQGQSFTLTLSFEKSGNQDVTVGVEKPGAMAPSAQGTINPGSGSQGMGAMPAHR